MKKKPKIKVVFFDIGGVLITDPKSKEFWRNYSGAKHIQEDFGRGKLKVEEFMKKCSEKFKVPKKEFQKKYLKAYHSVSRIDEVINFFKNLKIEKHILSDTNPVHMPYLKKNFQDVLSLAQKVYFSVEIGSKKIDPKTFELIINETGVSPESIVLVDNREDFIEQAKKARITAILFKNLTQLKKDFKKLGIK